MLNPCSTHDSALYYKVLVNMLILPKNSIRQSIFRWLGVRLRFSGYGAISIR